LQGEVSDCGIFTEELQAKMGLGIARVKGKLVVALVMDGMGKSAGLKEGDALLDARIDDNVVSLKVDRNGQYFDRRIDLSTGRMLAAQATTNRGSLPPPKVAARLGAQQTDMSHFKKYAGILQYGDGFSWPRLQNGDYSTGWTPQALHDSEVWADEFHRNGVDRPLLPAWHEREVEARKLIGDYMQKYWPDSVIGWRSYHLVLDRSGKLLECYQYPDDALLWADNDAEFTRLARGLIEGLGKSKVFACPPGSKVERFQTGVDIEVFHDPKKRY
jgi:hypothetical protein